ncbi:DUF3160 domain-containing protein [Methanocella conradii]|uniref:DUF3160 domain-containing protein n=1 Tax=Methanocella conradii TaxID=1175444 RepID=UPI0024B332C7|nr:DUF3160 domain-containing protein [Methanocella conradii]MDI6896535.1 DUF3160 domain-containing protein [Methanocella conradii]
MSGGLSSMRRRSFLKALGVAGGIMISSGAWGCITRSMDESATTKPTGNMLYTITAKTKGKFADFLPMPSTVTPSLKDYAVDASKLTGLDRMGVDDAGKKALAEKFFYLVPSSDAQIYDVYKGLSKEGLPAFVTTDSVLHAYHILFDYILRMLEVQRFSPDIVSLSRLMLDESMAQMESAAEPVKTAALKNAAFFAVALTLLGETPDVPSSVKGMVQGELALINAHEGFAKSPIFGYKEDYSQYVPRGHYTRNEALKKYFMAMMWYGRMMFRLIFKDDPAVAKEQTRMAILITLALKGKAFDLWKGIYEPTVFFVGESDDLSAFDYSQLLLEVYGSDASLDDLADDTKLQAFIDKAIKLKEPKIVSTLLSQEYAESGYDTIKGFRLMGQRFIPDSYMFQELVYAKVGTRLFPMGLDVMAVLGSKRAYEILDKVYNETRYLNYEKQMESLKRQFAALKAEDWTQNLYWCWLYCLMALLNEKGDGYPSFMKSQAWTDKELNTSLGSWTELRHDTILYAKQSYTMRTSAAIPTELAKGYVEPNPELYGRLASLTTMTIEGLRSRSLLLEAFSGRLTALKDLLVSLKSISEKELTSTALSDDDYNLIRGYGNILENLTTFPPEVSGVDKNVDKRMAIVADVHTDVNTGMVLKEAVGNPYHIFVAVPIEGNLTITKGAAFSYYEFKQPMSDRLTDEKWQEMLDGQKAPETPEWTKSFKA